MIGSDAHSRFTKKPKCVSNQKSVSEHADARGVRLRWNDRRIVDGVEKQTDLSEVAFLGHEDDAGHVVEVVVVGFFFEGGCLIDTAGGEDAVEAGVEVGDGFVGEGVVDTDDHFFAHPAVGVEIPVEVRDVLHGVVHIVGEVDEVEIGLGDESVGQEVVCDESAPGLPIVAIRTVHHHDGNDGHFSGLHECEDFKTLVMRSKSARKEGEGTSLFGEVQLAGEKIIEVDELRVAVNGGIGGLLEREPDIESETLLGSGSGLGGAHDAISAACDEHVTSFDDFFPECEGLCILGLGGFRAGAAEDGYLADAVVAGENASGSAHFAQGAVHELEFGNSRVVPAKTQRGVDHFLDVSGGIAFGDFSRE